jgi:hypothetical protein
VLLQLDPRFSLSMYIKSALILTTIAGSAYCAFYGTTSFLVCLQTSIVPQVHHLLAHGLFLAQRCMF